MKSIFPIKAPWSLWIAMLMTLNLDGTVCFIHVLEARVTLASTLAKAMLMMFLFSAMVFPPAGVGTYFLGSTVT